MGKTTDWRRVVPKSSQELSELAKSAQNAPSGHGVFPNSVILGKNYLCLMVTEDGNRKLVVADEGKELGFNGVEEVIGKYNLKICPLSPENAETLRNTFRWTAPTALGQTGASIGLGDRLGIASPGHIRVISKRNIRPVLAQQSIRELDLTGRNYQEVIDAASWAVFQEGYKEGFGADGDHLKRPEDVKKALGIGFSMITLDCSEHIDDTVMSLKDGEIQNRYNRLSPKLREFLESEYLDKEFILESGRIIKFDILTLAKNALVYLDALKFAEDIYHSFIKHNPKPVDFEVSIDEIATPTTPQDHFFVASELKKRAVKVNSVAPRFVGEFQKGIDYIGDTEQFTKEFQVHAEIADHFGYKISVHSGSDKFSVFASIGRLTKGRFHVKTAGTNWLEAVRVIAMVNPTLYRQMHSFALDNLDEALKYYHVTIDQAKIPELQSLTDQQLPDLMDQNDARQALHITYGLILQAKNTDGSFRFRDRIYHELELHQDLYALRLKIHIGKHLDELGV